MKIARMLATSAALLVVGSAAPAARAQMAPPAAQPGGGMRGGGMRSMLLRGIDLTDAQKAKVDSIREKYRGQMGPMQPGTPPDSATRAHRMQLMQAESAEIRALLTPEQQTTFDRNTAEMRERMQRRRPPARG